MTFIHEDFLLYNAAARRLYHEVAVQEPILDYHNHLPPKDIAENRRFTNLFEIWLEGDHYKWRAMRTNGIAERFCTGDATPYEKFFAYAETVPHTLRNPLYHWTHLELARYFGITDLLSSANALEVWEAANTRLAEDDLTAQGILEKFAVTALCTTDDPADPLTYHEAIRNSGLSTRVYPTFRPDKALNICEPEVWNLWLEKLGATANTHIVRLSDLRDALEKRHTAFHDFGGRLSDHGLPYCYADSCNEVEADAIFDRVRSGRPATPEEHARFAAYLMHFFGQLDAARGWTKQLHLGALRNNNSRAFATVGPDTGFDSMGDWLQAMPLATYLDRLDRENALPKIILYNNNPTDTYVFATMCGNFQDGAIAGKIQLGSGWWFLDQKEGIEMQINALSNTGLLSRFVGMLTDSRSFLSFSRHEYFRRVLCNLLGTDMERGEIPRDFELVGEMVRRICYGNAKKFLGLETA